MVGEVKINGSSHIFLEKTEMGGPIYYGVDSSHLRAFLTGISSSKHFFSGIFLRALKLEVHRGNAKCWEEMTGGNARRKYREETPGGNARRKCPKGYFEKLVSEKSKKK